MGKINLMICIGLIFAFIGCNKAKEEATQEIAKTAKGTSEVLKVKDFYLGMNIDEVPAILKQKLQKSKVSAVEKQGNGYRVRTDDGNAIVGADKDKKVILIFIADVDELFNVADMNAQEFAENFAKSYNIPNMDLIQDDESYDTSANAITSPMNLIKIQHGVSLFYTYTSPAGFKIRISEKYKWLEIKKVASEGERKFD